MSTPKTAKGKQLKGQTVMGDYFSKPNNSKSTKSKGKGKVEQSPSTIGTKRKVEQSKQDKKVTPINKKTGKSVERKSDLPVEKKASVEKRPSLKRKVTGAGMFSFSWTRGAQKDTEQYRNGYPDKEDDPGLDDNCRFYMNQIPSKPDGDYIDQIHVNWWGDYKLLEVHHGYIQWLFPIRESGLNWHAQELQLHEIKKIQRSKKAMQRILKSYKMMLDFYGMELENEEDGTIVRGDNWRDRFRHLNRSFNNYLRITRILKCLGEFGYEHLKKNFVKFILYEGLVEGTLPNVIDSCVKYWIGVLKDDDEREEIFDYYEKLLQDENLQTKRRNRSPSPPSSYWSDKIKDSKSDKKSLSKNGKNKKADSRTDKKDEVNRDNENEFSDDGEDGTLYYAMSLIDEDLPKGKSRKDHEMSDSGPENDDHPEESQEMAHWKEEAKKSKDSQFEGVSECGNSKTGKIATGKNNSVYETEEEGHKRNMYYAMSLIDDDLPKEKSRKDHEKSDSGPENYDHPEESKEMAHWKEEIKKYKSSQFEGGSESGNSKTGKIATGKIKSVYETEEEGPTRTLYYAMSLIDEYLQKEKSRKDHDISDSGCHPEENEMIALWKEEEKQSKSKELEEGSKCGESVPGKKVTGKSNSVNETEEEGPNRNLYYAMSLIDEYLQKGKSRKDQDMSYSWCQPKESQVMAHWKEEAKKSKNNGLEDGSECVGNVPGRMATGKINSVNETEEEGPNRNLYYAKRLIDEYLQKEKPRKDHEISDSVPENYDHPEECEVMAYWKEKAKKSKNNKYEGGRECDDSVPGKMAT
ncbi:uncharacterized protein LOC132737980 isoform X1 [Ruditapes philippinarum]|uniref:uncharacterized protein LOC132737980 isoform X1 n=1 Tax=Ruditapes philippinarum TaxID=129788 RepID=UPI00295A6C98|nr:uncharacterized protein LOC132737980 isoform X1 [Ruditapes philippinarum]